MSKTHIIPEWVGLDWGTTHLRAFAMRGAGMLARAASDDGMGTLSPEDFVPAFARITEGWSITDTTPVVACGMVGSRQGWAEAPYRKVPCTPLGGPLACVPGRPAVRLVPGLSQAAPPDVMRGEETQIAGFLALNPGWDGVICLPGTHTKWAEVSAGEVVSFQTFLTGELFALLAQQSVLRHSVTEAGWDPDTFSQAVADALAKPERLAARLFEIRAAGLLLDASPQAARARLSGLLIGAELAAARPYWLGRQIAILGNGAQADAYAKALGAQGVPATLADADRMTLAGLTAAWRSLKETTQ